MHFEIAASANPEIPTAQFKAPDEPQTTKADSNSKPKDALPRFEPATLAQKVQALSN